MEQQKTIDKENWVKILLKLTKKEKKRAEPSLDITDETENSN